MANENQRIHMWQCSRSVCGCGSIPEMDWEQLAGGDDVEGVPADDGDTCKDGGEEDHHVLCLVLVRDDPDQQGTQSRHHQREHCQGQGRVYIYGATENNTWLEPLSKDIPLNEDTSLRTFR